MRCLKNSRIKFQSGTSVAVVAIWDGIEANGVKTDLSDQKLSPGQSQAKTMLLNNTLNIADQRVHVRHACEATIEWSYFNQKAYFSARILNFSRGGIYIETAKEINPGSTICTHLEKIIYFEPNLLSHDCLRLVSLGQVIWCRRISVPGRTYNGAGIKYPFLR